MGEFRPREHHDGLFGEVKTGNTPLMAPTTKWYGIGPWLAPEDKKLRHDASRECYHSAANVVVGNICGRSAGRQRAQRAERRSDLAESWLLAEKPLACHAKRSWRSPSATPATQSCADKVVCERWCVTKLCVKDGG